MTNALADERNDQSTGANRSSLPPWMHDAVVYVIDMPAFRDSNGDGIGDLQGVRAALDDLADLGVNLLWLLPFYPSPRRDNGFDVADHCAVDPRFGTLDDLRELVADAHARGIRILIDLIINHTSDQHPWFKAALDDGRDDVRDRYVWKMATDDEDALQPVFPGFEESVWTYHPEVGNAYLHHFYHFEPDLNPLHPDVQAAAKATMRFWLDLGVDAFRIDAAPFLGTDGRGGTLDTHTYLRRIRGWLDEVNPDAMLVAEVDLPPEDLAPYFGDGDQVHALFHFGLSRNIFLAMAERSARAVIEALRQVPPAAPGQGWVSFLRHHDEISLSFMEPDDQETIFARFAPEASMRLYERGIRRRLAPLLDNNWDWMRWIFSLHMSLPAVPLIMFGDEVGAQENLMLPERASVRTPMPWTEPGATPTHMLLPNIVALDAAPIPVTTPAPPAGSEAFRTWLADLIRLRREHLVDHLDRFELLGGGDDAVLVHRYRIDDTTILCLHNFADAPQTVGLPGHLRVSEVLLASTPDVELPGASLTIEPFGYRWLRGTESPDEAPTEEVA